MEKLEIRGVVIGLLIYVAIYLVISFLFAPMFSRIGPGPLSALLSTAVWIIPGVSAGWNSRRHPIFGGVLLGVILALVSFLNDQLLPLGSTKLDELVVSFITVVPNVAAASALGFLAAGSRRQSLSKS